MNIEVTKIRIIYELIAAGFQNKKDLGLSINSVANKEREEDVNFYI